MSRLAYDRALNANVMTAFMVLGVVSLGTGGYLYHRSVAPVASALQTVKIPRADGTAKAWGEIFPGQGVGLYARCRLDARCRQDLRYNPPFTPLLWFGGLGILLLFGAGMTSAMLHRSRDQLDTARILKMNYLLHPSAQELSEGKKDAKGVITDPVVTHFGFVIEERSKPNKANPNAPIQYEYANLKKIGVTSKLLHEHMMVYGPTGSGKTSRALMPLLMGFAERGDATVVVDFKFPDIREGLMETVSLFARQGLPVWSVVPYEPMGNTIPLFDYIRNHRDGRDLAAVLMPVDEYKQQSNEFYVFTQHRILGSIMKVVADSLTPNWAEVVRICKQPHEQMEEWINQNADATAKADVARVLKDQKLTFGGFMAGILNAIEPFEDPMVARTFASVEATNFSVREFIETGGLLYLGFNSSEMRSKRGEILMRIINDWLVSQVLLIRADEAVTGNFGKDVRLIYDEAGNLGKLRWLLKDITTVRSKRISFILGIQNEEHMELVYGKDQWLAVVQNIGTHLTLPSGLKDEAARKLSQNLGEREIIMEGNSTMKTPGGILLTGPAGGGLRFGNSTSTSKRALFTPSQITEWPAFLGIYRTKGNLPPAVLATLPVYDPQPVYYGLDGRKFTLDNRELVARWKNAMGDLSIPERAEEIFGVLGKGSGKEADILTARDVLTEWVENLVADGVQFTRKAEGVYRLNYHHFDGEMRGPEGVRAMTTFITSGWVKVDRGAEEFPDEWEWIELTPAGLAEIGAYGERALQASTYTARYVAERKRLDRATPGAASFEEAREILPKQAARNITEQLIRYKDPHMEREVYERATDLMMENFDTVAIGTEIMSSIRMSMRFEPLLQRAMEAAQAEFGLGGDGEDGGGEMADDFFARGDGSVTVEAVAPARTAAWKAPPGTPPAPPALNLAAPKPTVGGSEPVEHEEEDENGAVVQVQPAETQAEGARRRGRRVHTGLGMDEGLEDAEEPQEAQEAAPAPGKPVEAAEKTAEPQEPAQEEAPERSPEVQPEVQPEQPTEEAKPEDEGGKRISGLRRGRTTREGI